uniref:G-protein coupled receptors family 1 profile domain-containing protein n=1 Tax=Monodelphis domestica TaxID=13616 RepID=A0A5F8H1M5_MONDO
MSHTPQSECTGNTNETLGTDFILLGLFNQSKCPTLLYSVILVVFIVALTGNATLILLIYSDLHLHTPMYFFISQLSLMVMMYISVTVPKMLLIQVTGIHASSFPSCGIEMFLYVLLGGAEFFLLAAMSYDRYMVIYHPLQYPILMNHQVCMLFEAVCWLLGSINGFMLTFITMTFPFYTSLYKIAMYRCCVFMILITVTVISSSYSLILLTVYRMTLATGRKKAFVTCSSHMSVVILFYGSAVYTYMLPTSYHSVDKDMMISVFYSILTPVLNPLIDILGKLTLRINQKASRNNQQL